MSKNIWPDNAPPVTQDPKSCNRPSKGIITPLITPLVDRDELDYAGLERLIEYVLQGGVHGLFLLGTTGEAAALSIELRRRFVRQAIRLVAGRVPMLVGIGDNSIVTTLRLAQEAADAGATAVVLTTPSYLPLAPKEIVRYVCMIERDSPLPILLYNMPRLTSHWFHMESLPQLMQLPKVIGLKDSSGDAAYFADARKLSVQRPDWLLFAGQETTLVDAVNLGADGCVSGSSNLWPQLLVSIYRSASTGDCTGISTLQQQLLGLGKLYQLGTYSTGVIRGIKCALEILGICSGRMADPFEPCNPAQRSDIERQLRNLGLMRAVVDRML